MFQLGTCTRTECRYVHEMGNAQEKKELLKITNRSRSPSPAAGKAPCNQWIKTGTCTYGDGCNFAHDPSGAAPAVPKAASKGGKGKGKSKK